MKNLLSLLAGALVCSGCWTLHKSDYPSLTLTPAPADRDVVVQVSGFEATMTEYVPVHGYETVWRAYPVHHHRHHHHCHNHVYVPEMQSTTYYLQNEVPTTTFVKRACEGLEDYGFIVGTTNAQYRVDVNFGGPLVNDGDRTATALWLVLSGLSADYTAQMWTASLRIYDAQSNKLLLHTEFTEKYQAAVWGLVPIFSPGMAEDASYATAKSWCLTALTDRALAEATAFLALPRK